MRIVMYFASFLQLSRTFGDCFRVQPETETSSHILNGNYSPKDWMFSILHQGYIAHPHLVLVLFTISIDNRRTTHIFSSSFFCPCRLDYQHEWSHNHLFLISIKPARLRKINALHRSKLLNQTMFQLFTEPHGVSQVRSYPLPFMHEV